MSVTTGQIFQLFSIQIFRNDLSSLFLLDSCKWFKHKQFGKISTKKCFLSKTQVSLIIYQFPNPILLFRAICQDFLNFNLLIKGKVILGTQVVADGITGTSGSVPVVNSTSIMYLSAPFLPLFNVSRGTKREPVQFWQTSLTVALMDPFPSSIRTRPSGNFCQHRPIF